MALSLDTLRSIEALTNLYGRRLALDKQEMLVGPKTIRHAIEDLATSATTLLAYGMSRVITSGSSQGPTQHNLPVPIPGVTKWIVMNSTSTGSAQFLSTPNGASILAGSDGTTKSLVNLLGQGGGVQLFATSSAIWTVVGVPWSSSGSGVNISYTTST